MPTTNIETLNQRTAYLPKKPIQIPSDMPKPIHTQKMSKDWIERTSHLFWSTSYEGNTELLKPIFQEMLGLRDFILTFGGDQVCMPFIEDDIQKITERGQLWYGDRSKMIIGRNNGCHENSAILWEENRLIGQENRHLATGYALSDDGMWRQHSWIVDTSRDETFIIETTTERVAYFGFVLTDDEAKTFSEQQ